MKNTSITALLLGVTMATQTIAFAVVVCYGGLQDKNPNMTIGADGSISMPTVKCSQPPVGPNMGTTSEPENGCVSYEITPCFGKKCDPDGRRENFECSGNPDIVDRQKTTKQYYTNIASVVQPCTYLVSTATSIDGQVSIEKLVSCVGGG